MLLADVTVPYGDWVSNAVTALQPVATLALTGIASYALASYVPKWMQALAGGTIQSRVNEVLNKAVSSAIARTQGAVAGKELSIPISSQILGRAVQYAVDQAPALIKSASAGKLDNLMNMVLARMHDAGIVTDGEATKKAAQDNTDFSDALSALGGKQPDAPKPKQTTKGRTLKKGSAGSDVAGLQKKLGITADGYFGSETEKAVKAFQSTHGLTADGVVGPSTWKALG